MSFPRRRESRCYSCRDEVTGKDMKSFYVYMLCSGRNGTLYIGVTSDLIKRIYEHKNNFVDGFTKKYGVHSLVWYEFHDTVEMAIQREKQIKKWERSWKLRLIEENNPEWKDLYDDLLEGPGSRLRGNDRLGYMGYSTGMSEDPNIMTIRGE